MQLEQTIFGEITKILGAVPEPAEDMRRRRGPRFHVDREINIKSFGAANAVPRPVTLVNISALGLCILDRLTISAGDQFIAYLPLPGGAEISVLCTARQSRFTSSGAFRIGAEFTGELERDSRYVRVFSPSQPVEAATESREVHPPATMRIVGGPPTKPVRVEVRKFDRGIFDLMSPHPVSPGEQVILEFLFQQRVQAWKCTALQVRAEGAGRYSVSVSNDGPANMPPPETGALGWLKRVFRSFGD